MSLLQKPPYRVRAPALKYVLITKVALPGARPSSKICPYYKNCPTGCASLRVVKLRHTGDGVQLAVNIRVPRVDVAAAYRPPLVLVPA